MSRIREDITRLTACLTTPAETPNDRPELLTLLLGHLPIRAGLWRLPAARLLFPDSSRIMVAREDEESLVVECIGDGFDPVSTELIPECSACVVVPPSGASPELLDDLASDRLAIITGGDQAAIVAAYALVKGLTVPADVPVELIVVGQEESQAAETAERLADAVVRHLGRVVEYRGAIPAIGADTGLTQSRMVDRPMDGLLSVVREVRGVISPEQESDAEARHRVANHEGLDCCQSEPPAPELQGAVILDPLPDPDRVELQPADFTESSHVPLATAPINPGAMESESSLESSRPQSSSAAAEQSLESPSGDHLSDHLDGLSALPIRCPDHQSAEFALDQSGKLHLVVSASEAGGVPAIMGWTARHWSLLGQVVSELPPESEDPVVHVLGQNAQELIGLRDTPWQTHLLVPVAEPGPNGFACVPLSREEATQQGR